MRLKALVGSITFFWAICTVEAEAASCVEWFKGDAPRWQEPQDTAMAILEPDCYAWRLFIALNWPAEVSAKLPDPAQPFGAAVPVVWETWRNARNDAPDTVFPRDGSDPGPWLDGSDAAIASTRFSSPEPPLQQVARAIAMFGQLVVPMIDEMTAGTSVNETRLNRETYEFIRDNELYNLNGQIVLANSGAGLISFPVNSKEIKAQWRLISEEDKPRYHWAESETPDGLKTFGLTALHITTKDLPNWFWATFEHIDNREAHPDAPGTPTNPKSEGWLLPSVDRFSCPTSPFNCELAPTGIGLQGTPWENYRLRGTQIDFVDSSGKPLRLANSQPEATFQTTSSCITCHALSSVNEQGRRLEFFDDSGNGPIGVPTGYFDSSGARVFTQLDFVWSLFRAQRKQ